ncbi:MAG TPA: hypothetical protein VM219_08945 [Phycisphaerae bacterium]|nr:hypothetical protein [Phycisphaerae bacterium]HUX03006.1 hypothetical protein [Phycisphaerae bacterium]
MASKGLTVQDILILWLTDHGYDGLVSDGADCGCLLDDLIPCDAPCETCRPGYRGPDLTGEGDWAIYGSREAVGQALAASKALADGEADG